MRRNSNNTAATSTANRQSTTASANAAQSSAPVQTSAKPSAKPKALAWADLTDEQKALGHALMYIMERTRSKDGKELLVLDKTADPIVIRAAEGLDEKAAKSATWNVSVSARQTLKGTFDAQAHAYSFPRAEFAKFVEYYKAAKAAGVTTLKAAEPQQAASPEQPKPAGAAKPSRRTKPVANQSSDMITKAEALARCRKALAIALTKDMIDCMDDEVKALFA